MPRDNSSNDMRREIRKGISFGLRRVQVFDSTTERHPDPPTPSAAAALGAGKKQDTATEATANAASAMDLPLAAGDMARHEELQNRDLKFQGSRFRLLARNSY